MKRITLYWNDRCPHNQRAKRAFNALAAALENDGFISVAFNSREMMRRLNLRRLPTVAFEDGPTTMTMFSDRMPTVEEVADFLGKKPLGGGSDTSEIPSTHQGG